MAQLLCSVLLRDQPRAKPLFSVGHADQRVDLVAQLRIVIGGDQPLQQHPVLDAQFEAILDVFPVLDLDQDFNLDQRRQGRSDVPQGLVRDSPPLAW
jgi:hypothetical protein